MFLKDIKAELLNYPKPIVVNLDSTIKLIMLQIGHSHGENYLEYVEAMHEHGLKKFLELKTLTSDELALLNLPKKLYDEIWERLTETLRF